jgi:Pectate lyase superfamily protein
MTVPSTTRKAGPYTGNGVQTVFPFSFKVFSVADVKVVSADLTGTETALSSGYTVNMNVDQVASPGGSVTLSLPLVGGYKLTVLGNLPYDQTLAIPGGGNYNPVAHENALDRIVEQIQQLAEALTRKFGLSATTTTNATLPAPSTGSAIGWDSLGNLVNIVLSAGTSLVDLVASSGSSLVGYLPAGTGAVTATVQTKLRERVSIKDFGAKGDGTADDTAAFTAAKAYAGSLSTPVEITFPQGIYLITASPDWNVNRLTLTPLGQVEIRCTGTGPALNINGAAASWVYELCVGTGFILKGTSTTTQVFIARKVAHCKFGKITVKEGLSYGFNVELAVACTFDQPSCSINEQAMTTVPGRGFRLASYGGLSSTANTVSNPIMEGPLIGIDFAAADFNTIIGGTAEACTAHGVIVAAGSKGNRLVNLSCEANTTTDILDQGTQTVIEGGYFTKLINCISAVRPTIQGSRTQIVQIDAATTGATVEDITVSSFAAGGYFSGLGSGLSKRNIYNVNTSTYDTGALVGRNPTTAYVTQTVGASPYTYTNPAIGWPTQVIVRGGTVSQIEFLRNGSLTTIGGLLGLPSAGVFQLMPGDAIKVNYTVLPEVITIPM